MKHSRLSIRPARGGWAGFLAGLALAASLCLLIWPARAGADELPAGSWRAEPMTVRWVVGDWGETCGPRPSGGGDPGGAVRIAERGGELFITGGSRDFSTDRCWAMHPGLVRRNHARGERTWKTTCRTAANDARQEVLETTITLAGDTLTFSERGQYQFSLQGQKCAASSGRWRTYRRSIEPPPAQPASSEGEPGTASSSRSETRPCARRGPPARIEVRPSRKLMRPGESFRFRALVRDARGCPLSAGVEWALEPPRDDLSLDQGTIEVAPDARDAAVSVVVTAASQSVRAGLEVVSEERYAALLASGDFNADGASERASMAVITSGSIGAREAAPVGESSRKWEFVGVVSGIALLFAILGAWLLRRASRARRPPAAVAATRLSDAGRSSDVGATTRWTLEEDSSLEGATRPTRSAPLDQTRLETTSELADGARPPRVNARWVCPACGSLYEQESMESCPKDGARVLPVNA